MSHHNSSHPEPVGKMPERQILTCWSARRAAEAGGRTERELEAGAWLRRLALKNGLRGQRLVAAEDGSFSQSSLAERPIQTLRIRAMVKLDCWTFISEAADKSSEASWRQGMQYRGGFLVTVFLSQHKNDS